MKNIPAYAAMNAKVPLTSHTIERRDPGPHDILIDILYCGICHSDIHQARDEWGGSIFPMVPGHEIVGTVSKVGSKVSKWSVGDTVGVGCFVDSCRKCEQVSEQPSNVVIIIESDGEDLYAYGNINTIKDSICKMLQTEYRHSRIRL